MMGLEKLLQQASENECRHLNITGCPLSRFAILDREIWGGMNSDTGDAVFSA